MGKEADDLYIAGHRAGYEKGRDDGIGIGYADAKLRAYRALDAIEQTGTPATAHALKQIEDAFKAMLGGR